MNRDRILKAALQLVDDQGVEALSMRRLGGELGVDPMAIYHHLPSKDAVLAGLVGLVFAEMDPSAAADRTAGWHDRVRAWAHAYHALARGHPNFVLQLVSNASTAATVAVQAGESLYQAFLDAGLSPHEVVRAADLVVDYINGFALAEVRGSLHDGEDPQALVAELAARPAGVSPALRATIEGLAAEELRADLDSGLEIILWGLERLTPAAQSGGKAVRGG